MNVAVGEGAVKGGSWLDGANGGRLGSKRAAWGKGRARLSQRAASGKVGRVCPSAPLQAEEDSYRWRQRRGEDTSPYLNSVGITIRGLLI